MLFRLRNMACVCFLLVLGVSLRAQNLPEFNMSDTTLTECQGILYDSGGEGGQYGNNEDFTLVINAGQSLTITFLGNVETDPGFDFLTFYDGPNTASPMIGQYSGVTLPPNFTTSSGFLTITFTSDNSAIYLGWALQWDANVPPPIPPNIDVPLSPLCNTSSVAVGFSYPIACAWLNTAEWTLSRNGEEIPVIGYDDLCNGDSTSLVNVQLGEAFTRNCSYHLELFIEIPDECGQFYPFTLTHDFIMDNCEADADVVVEDNSICPGQCTALTTQVGDCFTYTFTWNQGLPPTAGPHTVCPLVTTTYQLLVTEVETGQTKAISRTVFVLSSAIITPSDTICQSVEDIVLEAESPGTWTGPGIWEDDSNVFDPDSANVGLNEIIFEAQGCVDTVTFFVIEIQTDDITAACPGSGAIQLNATPAGGIWDGPFTTPEGIFDPSAEGSYTITYTTPQCVDLLTVNVDSITGTFSFDTLCQSILEDTLQFSPLGGYWSGPGILDSLNGIFVPGEMPPGDVELTYTINGCEQIFTGYIKEINIGPSFVTVCPAQEPMVWYDTTPLPIGGYWEGDGVINTVTGLYDPSIIPNDTYTSIIYYAPNGCSDTTFIYNITTDIGLDSAWLCLNDDPLELIENVVDHSPPYGGVWLGTGVLEIDTDYWIFSQQAAGVGVFTLTYEENTCSDEMVVTVFPSEIAPTYYEMCTNAEPVLFDNQNIANDAWAGPGITDPLLGWFDPSIAGAGNHEIRWLTVAGCTDTVNVFVEQFEEATIDGLSPFYCFKDSLFDFQVSPTDGSWSGNLTTSELNPALLGEGVYEVVYAWQGQLCESTDTATFEIYPELVATLSASDTVLCGGQGSVLTVVANGGNPNANYIYQWSDGGFPIATHTASPDVTTTITITVSDGCSDEAINDVLLTVLPDIEISITTTDTICFGETGAISATVTNAGNFEYNWNGVISPTVEALAGATQYLTVTDLDNGCEVDTFAVVPAYPPISAAFSINPNSGCVSFDERDDISFIDLSQNAVSGNWDFGNGQVTGYIPGNTPDQAYPSAGTFTITLVVQNVGACADTATATLCILPEVPLFIPDIFSPNGDGRNDVFYLRGHGVEELEFFVWNRWGQLVFSSRDINQGWDGSINGKPQPSGNYIYNIRARLSDGSEQELKGEVALIR